MKEDKKTMAKEDKSEFTLMGKKPTEVRLQESLILGRIGTISFVTTKLHHVEMEFVTDSVLKITKPSEEFTTYVPLSFLKEFKLP